MRLGDHNPGRWDPQTDHLHTPCLGQWSLPPPGVQQGLGVCPQGGKRSLVGRAWLTAPPSLAPASLAPSGGAGCPLLEIQRRGRTRRFPWRDKLLKLCPEPKWGVAEGGAGWRRGRGSGRVHICSSHLPQDKGEGSGDTGDAEGRGPGGDSGHTEARREGPSSSPPTTSSAPAFLCCLGLSLQP